MTRRSAPASGRVIERARASLAAGNVAAAYELCRPLAASGSGGDCAAAHLVLAACAERAKDLAGARAHVDAAVRADPSSAVARYAQAQHLERAGDVPGAIASLEHAVRLHPKFVPALQLLGILRGERGDSHGAVEAFRAVVTIEPDNARGFNNLGNALRSLGRLPEARRAFERAVALRPDYDLALANVAAAWRDDGEKERAETLLRSVLARSTGKPPMRQVVVLLAGLLRERGALDDAEPLYRQAIAMAPAASAREWFNLGRLHAERDDLDQAREAFTRSFTMDATEFRGAVAARLVLPTIYDTATAVQDTRERYAAGIEELNGLADRLVTGVSEDQVLDSLRWTNFLLAYQGRDDCELQASYGRFVGALLERGAPRWREPMGPRARRSRVRVGFASSFFRVCTAGRYFQSWITDLPRDQFEVFVYQLMPSRDAIAGAIAARADRMTEFGGSRARPSLVAPVIRNDELDVLVYPELGMDQAVFPLAALRLAPRQLAGWGHPVTTGHPTIDGFISCSSMEPDDAQSHYSERLLLLPGIGTRYERVMLPDRVPRTRFGLPEGRVLLFYPQSLFKIHPDNDPLVASVLAANPEATLVMFGGQDARLAERFNRRFARALDAHGVSARERVVMLPLMSHDDYLRVNLACDAMLDTLYWSGGNTSLDALACGLPVVTLPGRFMRGRQSMAMLRIVGVPELVAGDEQEYLTIASRLAQDPAWRADLASRIRAGCAQLFDTAAPVRAFADLLQRDEPSGG